MEITAPIWRLPLVTARSIVEIQFATGRNSGSMVFPVSKIGINIFAADVDLDSDQDLVITSDTSWFPAAVWLNSGRGHFEQGMPWRWAAFLTNDDTPGFHSNHCR